jgi:hypothetical protein
MPNGDLKIKNFDKNGIMRFEDLDNQSLTTPVSLNYPEEIDLYNDEIVKWAKDNAVI